MLGLPSERIGGRKSRRASRSAQQGVPNEKAMPSECLPKKGTRKKNAWGNEPRCFFLR